MSQSTSSSSAKTSTKKLHKRGINSTPSLPSSPPPFANGVHSQFATPYATYEEPFPDIGPAPTPSSSVPKIKPYLRKMSTTKEDQGMIDLSKSTSVNDRLAGLGIQDFGPTKSAADVTFAHSRRGHHGRSISGESRASTGSGSFKPTQPFLAHPMAKVPRPYTPPTGQSYASSLNDEEANESEDIVEDEFKWASGYNKRRSMSISSNNPTPLSQTLNASELGLLPKLTSASQTNLSMASNHSDKSSDPKKGRSRRNTELSQQEHLPSPTSRTSLDKALGFVGRRSDTVEPQTRDEMIAVARKKFEEKEASKDRKYESKRRQSESKEQERQRKKADKPKSKPVLKHAQTTDGNTDKSRRRRKSSAATVLAGAERDEKPELKSKKLRQQSSRDEFRAMSYDAHGPTDLASLPRYGTDPGRGQSILSEKTPHAAYEPQPIAPEKKDDGNWMRFSTWVQTRMLSCGGRD